MTNKAKSNLESEKVFRILLVTQDKPHLMRDVEKSAGVNHAQVHRILKRIYKEEEPILQNNLKIGKRKAYQLNFDKLFSHFLSAEKELTASQEGLFKNKTEESEYLNSINSLAESQVFKILFQSFLLVLKEELLAKVKKNISGGVGSIYDLNLKFRDYLPRVYKELDFPKDKETDFILKHFSRQLESIAKEFIQSTMAKQLEKMVKTKPKL